VRPSARDPQACLVTIPSIGERILVWLKKASAFLVSALAWSILARVWLFFGDEGLKAF